jgi:hypothetical protein
MIVGKLEEAHCAITNLLALSQEKKWNIASQTIAIEQEIIEINWWNLISRIYHLLKWSPQNESLIWQTCVEVTQGTMVVTTCWYHVLSSEE